MGKRFNTKSRNNNEIIVDNSSLKTIKLDWETSEYGGEDQSNIQVLPNKKRDTKVKHKEGQITRILSKKQRKLFEKIADKKKKKANRSSLLDSLAKVQVAPEELKTYTSISQQQTKGLKKHFIEQEYGVRKRQAISETDDGKAFNSISLNKNQKRLKLLANYNGETTEKDSKKNLNVIGFEPSDDDDDDDDGDDDDGDDDDEEEIEEDVQKDETTNGMEILSDIKDDKITCEKVNISNIIDKNEEILEENSLKNENDKEKISINALDDLTPPSEPKVIEKKPAVYVHVERKHEIQAARLKLPILGEEQEIMEIINENSIIIIAGETGSGKTTQIPQFLYESGYAENKMIGITEPRRVAAISMSKRVAEEMSLSNDIISYLIRFEGNTTNKTKIKFMTDGVLLKEIETDFLLNKYSIIILDEAHERSIYTDILIGLLSRIIPLRNKRKIPMKLIVMSATLKIEDFTENQRLFKIPPPVINVESRQYQVTIHHNKVTEPDYLNEAYKKILKIHTTLPEGGILVFLTGKSEVDYLLKKLRKLYPPKNTLHANKSKTKIAQKNDSFELRNEAEMDGSEEIIFEDDNFDIKMKNTIKNTRKWKKKFAKEINLPKIDLNNYKIPEDDTWGDFLDDDQIDNDDNIESDCDNDININYTINSKQPLWVLPLYANLSSIEQEKVFQQPPEGYRICVIATNVAETSLTIPNIKYVIDSGKQKTRLYDKITSVSAFQITNISQASANQRAGRAGRTVAGHCYRLYSSAIYNDEFSKFSIPEIQKKPVDDLMLQMRCMGIDKVINFPFPSPPDLLQLQMAEYRLKLLGALRDTLTVKKITETSVTSLGKIISMFPVSPRYGKMLALSNQSNLLPYTICIVAALSVPEVLQEINLSTTGSENTNNEIQKWHKKRIHWAGQGHSLLLGDPMILLRAVGASEYAGQQSKEKLEEFCNQNGLRSKAIIEIRKLRQQLTYDINVNLTNLNIFVDPKMPPPTDIQSKFLRQILLSGMNDRVAKKMSESEIKDKYDKIKYKYAYECPEMESPVFLHSSSVVRKSKPEWIIYQDIYETTNGTDTKMFIRGITVIEPEWLPTFAPDLCNLGEPLEIPAPRYDTEKGKMFCHVKGTFGRSAWELPETEILFPVCDESYRYFAMFFLNGEIFPKLKKYVNDLLTTPSLMIKKYAKLIQRTELMFNRLKSRQITSKEKLLEEWKLNSNFLLLEYESWLPESAHGLVSLMWPPIDKD